MTLRDYQSAAVDAAISWCKYKDSPCIIDIATGGGKSHIITALAEHYYAQKLRVCVLAHRKELLEQSGAKMNVPFGYYSASVGEKNVTASVIIAGIQSIYNKSNLSKFDVIIIDECHRVPNNDELGQYWQFINANKPAKVIGLTATPYRLQGGLLGWGEVIYEAKYPLLLKLGHLAPITNKVKNTPDLSNVKLVAGEYNEGLLSSVMEDPRLIEAAVQNITAYGLDKRSILIFCVGVRHAELLARYMPGSLVLQGATPMAERGKILEDFRAGRLKYLINCEILLEGFDAPNVDMIVCLRPTKSKALWEQMLGRGVRKHPGKESCFLLDMAGNLMEHGGLGTPYREKAKREREKPPGRICPECETYCPIAAAQCDDCGYEFPKLDPHKANHNLNADTKSGAVYEGHIEMYDVKGVSYREHINKKGARSLRVDYACNTKYGAISEWYSPHHENEWVRGKTRKLFAERGEPLLFDPKEYSMEELLFKCESLKKPIRITVSHEDKFPRVISYEYEKGSGNTEGASALAEVLADEIPF